MNVPFANRRAVLSIGLALGIAACGGPSSAPVSGRFVSVTAGAPLRHLVLEGTPTSMGLAAGRLLRNEIRAAAARPLPEGLRSALIEYARSMRPLAPAALLEELDAMAKEAGVSANDLFVREAAREGLRWHEMAGAPRFASMASAPGASSDVVVAFEGADFGTRDLVVVERRPKDGVATMVLARAGEVGALAGVTSSGLVLAAGEVDLPAERRTMRGPPMTWSLRATLEAPGGADGAIGRIASLCGHRVLAADATNRRWIALVTLAADAPKAFDANAWVLVAAGDDEGPQKTAQDDAFAAYPSLPSATDADALALAGRSKNAAGPVVRWTNAGLRFQTFDYVWATN